MAEVITNHLDVWTSALAKSSAGRGGNGRQEAYGIKRLRELILELAVRGKLVPQDPSDEPASVSLATINAQTQRLLEEGKLKKANQLPAIDLDQMPFEVPGGWEWDRLGNIGMIGSSSRVHQKDWKDSGVAFYRAREIVQLSKYGAVDNDLYITEELYQELTSRGQTPEPGDVMLTGVGTIGVPYVVREGDKFYFKDASVIIFKNYRKMSPSFLRCFFESPYWVKEIHKDSMGTTVDTLTISRANLIPIPLPPFPEQRRIVAKVDELMALCDQLEQAQVHSLEAHETLVKTLLGTLTRVASPQELIEAWSRIADHFDSLLTTEHSIDQVKQTILQLAFMGKLVPQDATDEPATMLLSEIASEKERLVGAGPIKAQQEMPDVSDVDKPYALPRGWRWTRLGNIGLGRTGKTPSTGHPEYYGAETAFIGPGQLTPAGEILVSDKFLTEEGCNYGVIAAPGDVLMVCIGGSIGKSVIANSRVAFNQQINCMRPIFVSSEFLNYLMNTPQFQAAVLEASSGSATPIINRSKWEELLVPIAPLAEQHRIVAKVNELVALCDALKARLGSAQTTQVHLADAIVEQAVA